jgi:hypothetical protein
MPASASVPCLLSQQAVRESRGYLESISRLLETAMRSGAATMLPEPLRRGVASAWRGWAVHFSSRDVVATQSQLLSRIRMDASSASSSGGRASEAVTRSVARPGTRSALEGHGVQQAKNRS